MCKVKRQLQVKPLLMPFGERSVKNRLHFFSSLKEPVITAMKSLSDDLRYEGRMLLEEVLLDDE